MTLRGARSTGGKHSRAYEGPEREGLAPPLMRELRRLLMVSHVRGLFSRNMNRSGARARASSGRHEQFL